MLASIGFLGVVGAEGPSLSIKEKEKIMAAQAEVTENYRSASSAVEAVEEFGSPLLDILSEEGLLETSSIGDLNIESSWNPDARSVRDGGATVDGLTQSGVHTAHIQITRSTDQHTLGIFVQPQLERAYAHLKKDVWPDDRVAVIRPVEGADEETVEGGVSSGKTIETQSGNIGTMDFCQQETVCMVSCCTWQCDSAKTYEVTCCVEAPCTTGNSNGCCIMRNADYNDCSDYC